MRLWLCIVALFAAVPAPLHAQLVPVGLAKVDITPDYPIRLAGFGFRRAESEGVTCRIWAKALVIGEREPVVVLALDACGVPQKFTEAVAGQLREKIGLPRERFALTVTHTHTAPMIEGYLPTLFGMPIPAEHQAHIQRYTQELRDKLIEAATAAMKNRRPAKLSWGIGTVSFAKNRRTPGGPVDHDFPLLAIHDAEGHLRGVWLNYACHCVTLSNNKISGDWAGFAAEEIEQDHRGVTALVSIGCGADSNPDSGVTGDKVDMARRQGMLVSAEVKRLLDGFLAPVAGPVNAKYTTFDLPLAPPPSEAELHERTKRSDAVGYHARVQLERLARGEKPATTIPYSVQTWSFGDALAMVFLPGEVVVDYALRLKKELHGQRLWINAYANHVPCYIPSERILKEGRYEGGDAMTYYDVPAPFAPGMEEKIVSEVKRQLEPTFRPPFDPNKLGGSKPLSPQQSARLIKVREGLTAELMLAEPVVQAPVALSFGPGDRLWVAEMRDYPKGVDGNFKPGGCVKLIQFQRTPFKEWDIKRATVFVDNIPFPTGVLAWNRGVLICAAPDILYAEDTNGDGKADVVKKLFSGFGTHNYQARVNSLEYGLDGWVYGSCGLFGGTIKSFNGKEYALGNRDFRIKPDTGELEPATGQTQQGRVRDDFDNWFGCDNSNLGRHYVLPDHYLRRNPAVKPPPAGVSLAIGPEARRLFPLRQQVQLFELSGPPGLPTAACGIGIYRDELLGRDLKGNLFTCEPVNLVVHQLALKRKGTSFEGRRAADEADHEFLGSTDNWFRPVQVRTGPDGCLWVVDMYRLVIEHPQWIPPADLARLDVRAGATMGRIYRIKPKDLDPEIRHGLASQNWRTRPRPRWDEGLAEQMDTPNGTVRDLAMMQLLWSDESRLNQNSLNRLEALARTSKYPEARVQALCTLDLLGELSRSVLVRALEDSNSEVCRTAVRLAERHLTDPAVLTLVEQAPYANGDPLHLQVVLTQGLVAKPEVGRQMMMHLMGNTDPYFVAGLLSSLRPEHHETFFQGILGLAEHGKINESTFQQAIAVLADRSEKSATTRMLQRLCVRGPKGFGRWQYQAVATLLEHAKFDTALLEESKNQLATLGAAARDCVGDERAPVEDRLAAIMVLAGPGVAERALAQDRRILFTLLGASQPPALQQAALQQLARHTDPSVAEQLCRQWKVYSPGLRSQIVEFLLSRKELQRTLVEAVAVRQHIPASHLDASTKQRLLTSTDPAIRGLAEKVFAATSADRAAVIHRYSQASTSGGDASKGKAVFARVCAACHKVGEQGHAVGPDLAALANRQASFLLQEILDPNRNLDSRYVEYVAVTKQGKTLTGVLANESTNSVMLRGKEGREETLLRNDLEELQATGKSLMPEGLEKEITPAEMNDLVVYLGTQNKAARTFAGNTPATVEAENGVLALRATQAAIHGEHAMFEPLFQNIGMWHGLNDYVTWTVNVPKSQVYDVYLDWACANESAGNRYSVETRSMTLTGDVAGTGGWSQYLRVRVGHLKLDAGLQQVKVRPAGPVLRNALMDLRTIYLAPAEQRLNLQEETSRQKPDLPVIPHKNQDVSEFQPNYTVFSQKLLDDKVPHGAKLALIDEYVGRAAELIAGMTTNLTNDTKEEYRRIPWIWRVAITAGRKNDTATLRRLLDVSMPKDNQPLREWQAVVIGGGIINGISQLDVWPRERLKELCSDPALAARWLRVIELSHHMADDENVPAGTRYDALRLVAMDEPDKAIAHLKKYLPAGTNEELQMGAVSGLVDVQSVEADQLIEESLKHLKGENLRLAIDGLLRTSSRFHRLVRQVQAEAISVKVVDLNHMKKLMERARRWDRHTQAKFEDLRTQYERLLQERKKE